VRHSAALLAFLLLACQDKPVAPLSTLSPKPLPRLADEPARATAAPVFGDPLPNAAVAVMLEGDRARLGPDLIDVRTQAAAVLAALKGHAALLSPDADTYLAQAAPLLQALDDAGVATYLAHPNRAVAYRLLLKDEGAFESWITAPNPGNIRIIQRADGFELTTNLGKLPGFDPNGPSVPLREGHLDIAGLHLALGKLQERFGQARDLCVVPSFGTELRRVAEAMAADFTADGQAYFPELCLVYPRSRTRDGGAKGRQGMRDTASNPKLMRARHGAGGKSRSANRRASFSWMSLRSLPNRTPNDG